MILAECKQSPDFPVMIRIRIVNCAESLDFIISGTVKMIVILCLQAVKTSYIPSNSSIFGNILNETV